MKTLEQLSDLRARLARAQRRENMAIRKMGEFTARGGTDRDTFKRLLGAVHEARLASVAVYDEWNAAVQAAHGDHSDLEPGGDAVARPLDGDEGRQPLSG